MFTIKCFWEVLVVVYFSVWVLFWCFSLTFYQPFAVIYRFCFVGPSLCNVNERKPQNNQVNKRQPLELHVKRRKINEMICQFGVCACVRWQAMRWDYRMVLLLFGNMGSFRLLHHVLIEEKKDEKHTYTHSLISYRPNGNHIKSYSCIGREKVILSAGQAYGWSGRRADRHSIQTDN